MIPQPDAQILAKNPLFATLWLDLTTRKIERDSGVSCSLTTFRSRGGDKGTLRTREVCV
jgi:hypothetical protein